MAPAINVGNTVLSVKVENINIAELKVGDIIVYKHPTLADIDNVAHRIVEIEVVGGRYRFKTKGDNLPEPDPDWVPENNIRSLVIGVMYKTLASKEFDLGIKSIMKLIKGMKLTEATKLIEKMSKEIRADKK